MPLKPGKSNIGPNIDELKKSGYDDPKQRVAIALDKAGLSNKKKSDEEDACGRMKAGGPGSGRRPGFGSQVKEAYNKGMSRFGTALYGRPTGYEKGHWTSKVPDDYTSPEDPDKEKSEEKAQAETKPTVFALQREMRNMGQVMVRRKLLSGDNQLIRADVISEHEGVLRVKMPGSLKPVEVKAADTIPATQLFGDPRNPTLLTKQYPESIHSLHRRFENKVG